MRYSPRRYWGSIAAAVGLSVLSLCLVLVPIAPGVSWSKAGVFTLLAVAGTSLAFASYRYADEVMLHNSKTAWFWGSLGAVIAMIPVMIFVGWRLVPFPLLPPRLAYPQLYFVLGMEYLFVTQGIGYLAASAYLRWLR